MSENKTQPTDVDPRDFISMLDNKTRKRDAHILLDMLKDITNEPAIMWGASIIGFGKYHYQYKSGREGDFFKTGFSPRKANIVIYAMAGVKHDEAKLRNLGPHKTGKACLYLPGFDKINMGVLEQILSDDYRIMTERYG